jgi:hypothetical protein
MYLSVLCNSTPILSAHKLFPRHDIPVTYYWWSCLKRPGLEADPLHPSNAEAKVYRFASIHSELLHGIKCLQSQRFLPYRKFTSDFKLHFDVDPDKPPYYFVHTHTFKETTWYHTLYSEYQWSSVMWRSVTWQQELRGIQIIINDDVFNAGEIIVRMINLLITLPVRKGIIQSEAEIFLLSFFQLQSVVVKSVWTWIEAILRRDWHYGLLICTVC